MTDANKAYYKTEKGKESRRRGRIAYKKKYRSKISARKKVYKAIKAGRLIRQPCEKCSTTEDIQAHHDDYSKPFDVRWLCREHHLEWHRDNTAIYKDIHKAPPSDRIVGEILNAEAVKVIRYARKYMGTSTKKLAGLYGIHINTVNDALRGETWAEVCFP